MCRWLGTLLYLMMSSLRYKNVICSFYLQQEPLLQRVITPTRTATGHENKDLERWQAPLLAKQFVIASRVLPFLSVTICRAVASESDKTCHNASLSLSLRQAAGRL